MFSGIIDAVGEVAGCLDAPGGRTLVLRAPGYWTGLASGASVAIDGVCLTATKLGSEEATFDVIAETLRRTTLGGLSTGSRVNLQKSLAVGDRVDGHFVQGHVDAVAQITEVQRTVRECLYWLRPDAHAMDFVIPKGSVAIDGISLTIAEVAGDLFSVALIPTTLERTTLGDKGRADRVNIETDILARTVVHYLQSRGGSLPRDMPRGDTCDR